MTTRTLKTTLALALTTTLGALAPAPAHSAPRNLPEAWDGRALRLGERGFMTTVMFACTDRFETAHGLVLAMQKDKELYKAWLSGRLEAEDCRGFSRGDEVVVHDISGDEIHLYCVKPTGPGNYSWVIGMAVWPKAVPFTSAKAAPARTQKTRSDHRARLS